jgi:hypothetical protein
MPQRSERSKNFAALEFSASAGAELWPFGKHLAEFHKKNADVAVGITAKP